MSMGLIVLRTEALGNRDVAYHLCMHTNSRERAMKNSEVGGKLTSEEPVVWRLKSYAHLNTLQVTSQ